MSSETEISTPPSVSWGQKHGYVYVTFNVECLKPDIQINNKLVTFKGVGVPEQKLYEVEIPLYGEIDPDKSKYDNKGRIIEVILAKEKKNNEFWPFLTSDKKRHHWLKVDFNRLQDEDESGDDDTLTDDDDEEEEEEYEDPIPHQGNFNLEDTLS